MTAASPSAASIAGAGVTTSASDVPALHVAALSKRFGGVVALDGVSFKVEKGSIQGLVGENGAGKSTLVKILAGATHADSGEIHIFGSPTGFKTPGEARDHGLALVHQELAVLPTRSVLANLFVNREPSGWSGVSKRRMAALAQPVLEQLGLSGLDLDAPAGALTIADQQLLEIAKALILTPKVLLLDEPNSALNRQETQRLFAILRQLRADGNTMIYVSHRLEEVLDICDSVTVLRNGKTISTGPTRYLSVANLVDAMLGRSQTELFPPKPATVASTSHSLQVSDVVVPGKIEALNLEAESGELVGIAGLEGSGVESVLPTLFGVLQARGGEVRMPDGGPVPRDALSAARRGIAYIPPDRRRQGLMLENSIASNLAQVSVGALGSPLRAYSASLLDDRASSTIRQLAIKAQSPKAPAQHLSGGNQQKVVIGKWLQISPELILLDDPARGVDVGAKRELFGLIRQMQASGNILLMRSTELSELVGLCDRIIVFYRGRIVAEIDARKTSEKSLLECVNTGIYPD